MPNQNTTLHTIRPTNALMLKLYFLPTIYYKSDMFRSVLIIFRDLLNINKAGSYHTSIQHALLIFSNSVKMIKIDRNVSQL